MVTAILLKCIKENDPTAHISVIGSIKNSAYIKTFPFVDNVIQLDNNFLSKIKVFFKVSKFKYKSIIIHDNKRRSKFISYFLKSNNKIDISDFKDNTHIEIIKNILQKMKLNFSNNSLNILSHRNPKNNSYKNQIQLHFDEKWIFNDYIKKFINIEPTENEL